MKEAKFICSRVSREIVILADGRITSCCVDADGQNTFANIYEDDFGETLRKLRLFKQKLVGSPHRVPRCLQCYNARTKASSKFYDHFLKGNPSDEEIDDYINELIPEGLVIEPTTACNMTCIGCPTGLRNREGDPKAEKRTFMDMDKLKAWLTPYIAKIKKIRLFNYGETFLHPGAIDFCKFLTRMNPEIMLVIATNLLPLNTEEKIRELVTAQPDMLVVSLHGANRESVAKYMGPRADFERGIQLMKKIIAERNRMGLKFPYVIWKYIFFEWNDSDEEIEKAKALAKENNIDYLGFEVTGGRYASNRFYKGSKEFEELKKTDYFAASIYGKIARMNVKRQQNY